MTKTAKTTKPAKTAKTSKRKAQSPTLEAVHETAAGFHRLGFIDKRKMQEYDALCPEPIPDYDSKQIKGIRTKLNLSQPVFAAVLNTTLSTVVQWEGGKKHPRGTSLKLLNLADRKGLEAILQLGQLFESGRRQVDRHAGALGYAIRYWRGHQIETDIDSFRGLLTLKLGRNKIAS